MTEHAAEHAWRFVVSVVLGCAVKAATGQSHNHSETQSMSLTMTKCRWHPADEHIRLNQPKTLCNQRRAHFPGRHPRTDSPGHSTRTTERPGAEGLGRGRLWDGSDLAHHGCRGCLSRQEEHFPRLALGPEIFIHCLTCTLALSSPAVAAADLSAPGGFTAKRLRRCCR